MSNITEQNFDNKSALDQQLALDVAAMLANAIDTKSSATLVVSGGSTPLGLFEALSQQPLSWDKVTITLADERWLPPTHSDSNERLLRETLLVNLAQKARVIPLYNGADNALDGLEACNKTLAELQRFDVVVLGMGEDGHTASLFPQAIALDDGLALNSDQACVVVDPVTAPHQRMSMTLPRLLNSEQIIIHVTGDKKKAIIDAVVGAKPMRQWPISFVFAQQRVPLALYWTA